MAGAVQAPVEAFIVPALAVQVMPLVMPPVAVVLKVVTVLTSLVGAAGLRAATATVCGFTVRLAVTAVPAALVTVRMKFLATVMAPLLKAVPLVTAPTLLFTLPVPLLKVGVMVVVPPKSTGLVAATRPVATGRLTTVTVVVAVLVASSLEVAVMVTDCSVAGAVQAPVEAFMVPALADQVTMLVAPPLAVVLKVVVELTSLVGAAGAKAVRATVCGVSVTVAVAVVPAALVTVMVKVLLAVMTPLLKAVPLLTAPMLLSTVAVPLLKVGVMLVVPL